MLIQSQQHVVFAYYLMSSFSLGCGIGYGYLHRIPTRPVQLDTQNKNQSMVTGGSQEPADRTEVQAITSLLFIYEMHFGGVFFFNLIFSLLRCLQCLNIDLLVKQAGIKPKGWCMIRVQSHPHCRLHTKVTTSYYKSPLTSLKYCTFSHIMTGICSALF